MAMGTGPATAETCDATTQVSALAMGNTAETTPKPTEVSSAQRSGQPNTPMARPYL